MLVSCILFHSLPCCNDDDAEFKFRLATLARPCFGPPSPEDASRGLKQHGFARTSRFEVEDTFVGEGIGRAVFRESWLSIGVCSIAADDWMDDAVGLESTPATLQAYRHEFALIYSVTLSPTSLSLVLRCEAKTTDLTFTTALHSYFQLPSTVLPAQVLISPLQGLTYVNKVLGGVKAIEEKNEVAIVGEIDRVYHNTAKELFMSFPNSRIRVTKFNLSDVVVWNVSHRLHSYTIAMLMYISKQIAGDNSGQNG